MSSDICFHLEVRRGLARARLFNLGQAELENVLAAWSRGRVVEIGEREWDPADSSLVVLEGPRLDPAELAIGQGWSNASRVSRDVSAERLEHARAGQGRGGAVAVIAQGEDGRRAVESVLEQIGLDTVAWSAVRASLLDPSLPRHDLAAVVVVLEDPGAVLLLDARAEIAELDLVSAEPEADWPQALAERLRRIQA